MAETLIKFSKKMDSPYIRRRKLSITAARLLDRAVDLKIDGKRWEHIHAYSDVLNIPYHRVIYTARRLQVLGIVKLHKIGCMVFIEFLPPVGDHKEAVSDE